MKSLFCKKRQYIYAGFAILGISLAITTHALAQEPDAQVRESNVTQERVSEHRNILTKRVQDRIINLGRNMVTRMEAAIDRLGQIIHRMDSRIQKLNREGVGTAQANEMLGHAKDELAEAEKTLATIDVILVDSVTSDNPQETFERVKSQFLIAAQSIRDTQTHLRTTLTLLKEATEADRQDGSVDEM